MNRTASLAAILCTTLAAPAVAAERYPERPIRLIAPYPPGGGVAIQVLFGSAGQR